MSLLYADRSQRGKLRFTGPQRGWFLHQIMTQAFEDMAEGEARDTAMITAHGRMVGYLETIATEDAILVHFEEDLRGTFPGEIERYVFATQVEIVDVTDENALILVAGESWEALATEAYPAALLHPTRSLGVPAGYMWCPSSDRNLVMGKLGDLGGDEVTEEVFEEIRIQHVVPRWGFDMDTKTIPQEVGIDAWAVHFDKGCYVGQEAMAKIHFRGKPNRRLVRIEGNGLLQGTEVMLDDQKVGKVTSSAGEVALAVVRASITEGEVLEVDGIAAQVMSS